MATITLTANITNAASGVAPFRYSFNVNAACPVTLSDGVTSGLNELVVISNDLSVVVTAEYDNDLCPDEVLGEVIVNVVASGANPCAKAVTLEAVNVCYLFDAGLTNVSVVTSPGDPGVDGDYLYNSNPVNGNSPFAYTWSLPSGDATIESATNTPAVQVSPGVLNFELKLSVVDANGCVSETTIGLSPDNSAPGVDDFIKNSSSCTLIGATTEFLLSDWVDAADVAIADPASVVIVTAPIYGTVTINPSTGKITYTRTVSTLDQDILDVTVKSFTGVVSASAELSITCLS